MANIGESKEKAIILVQRWGAGKIAIGNQFKLKDTDRIITLINCDGFPYGKFVFDDGEEFNIGKYFDAFFVEIVRQQEEQKNSEYNESVWDNLDDIYNPKLKNGDDVSGSFIRKSFAAEQMNDDFSSFAYFDVTEIINDVLKDKNVSEDALKKLHNYVNTGKSPIFTKDRLACIFGVCKLEESTNKDFLDVILEEQTIGHLTILDYRFIFIPKFSVLTNLIKDYSFDQNSTNGFFNTAESYFDIALMTIEKYKNEFVPFIHSGSSQNSVSLGYQANASIKTLLAFACECYLKSALINQGKDLDSIKKLGHGLSVLFTSLDDDFMGDVFSNMEKRGYDIFNYFNSKYETNDLTENFMLDLAKVDDAFVDSRYNAENYKNTDYMFLYKFACALRTCCKNKMIVNSPFAESIESKMSKK